MVKNMKKIIISLMAIILVIGVANTVFATEGNKSVLDEIDDMRKNETGNISKDGEISEIPEGTDNKNTLNTETTPNNTEVKEELPETTPYTGIGDYSGLIFIAVFGISAIYAYKKVKEYNA